MSEDRFTVEERPDQTRYVLLDHQAGADLPAVIGEESYVDVHADGGDIERVLFHTGVSDDYSGQGLASMLVREVVEDVVSSGRRIVPVCPYVKAWLPKHPEYAEHVVSPRAAHLRAVHDQQSSQG